MYRYEVRGYIEEKGEMIPFLTITPPCLSAYMAEMYVVGRFKGEKMTINHDAITRILD